MFKGLDDFCDVKDSVLTNVSGGKKKKYKPYRWHGTTSFAYGVHYNPRTGKAYIDPAGFARTWGNNVVSMGWMPTNRRR